MIISWEPAVYSLLYINVHHYNKKGQIIMKYGYPISIDSKLETQACNRHLGLHDAVALQQPMKKS